MNGMRLYLLQYAYDSYYVEAPTIHEAISAWQAQMAVEQGPDEEPDSIALVYDRAVIRCPEQTRPEDP